MTRVLITGVTGQDGSYLAECLAAAGDKVFGLVRGQNNPRREWIERIVPKITVLDGDLLDQMSLIRAVEVARPDVVYNLAAITAPGMCWGQPTLTAEVTGIGALRVFEAVRLVKPDARIVHAASLARHGPYGAAKTFSQSIANDYRVGHRMYVACAVFGNHTSVRQGTEFLPRKVTNTVARIKLGLIDRLSLGDVSAVREWGYAPEYTTALRLLSEMSEPQDVVITTGRTNTVSDLVTMAFEAVDLDPTDYVTTSPGQFRPADASTVVGDPIPASRVIGWQATVMLRDLIKKMIDDELELLR